MASDGTGDFVAVWQSNGSSGSDIWGSSVQGQRYTHIRPPDPTVDIPTLQPLGLLTLLALLGLAGLRLLSHR